MNLHLLSEWKVVEGADGRLQITDSDGMPLATIERGADEDMARVMGAASVLLRAVLELVEFIEDLEPELKGDAWVAAPTVLRIGRTAIEKAFGGDR